jgi:hypothetical protein
MLKIHLIYMHFSITSQKANKEPHTTVLILISSLCDFSAFHQWGWSLPVLCCTGSFGKSNMFFVKKMLECFLFVYLFCVFICFAVCWGSNSGSVICYAIELHLLSQRITNLGPTSLHENLRLKKKLLEQSHTCSFSDWWWLPSLYQEKAR